ncbi:MAG: hypothetical protein LBI53_06080 [Candidatus Peribacteria bacterium]|nr:hypothetical protein [Candidatus Peribacteria bacterium]
MTKGDVLFDQYINNSNLSNDEKIQLLNEARGAYTQSREGGEIKEIYYQGAIKVIDKELESLSKDEEEIVNTILFIHV